MIDKKTAELFVNKKVNIVYQFKNGRFTNVRFYNGVVLKADENCLVIRDKFNHLVSMSYENIKKIEEVDSSERGNHP